MRPPTQSLTSLSRDSQRNRGRGEHGKSCLRKEAYFTEHRLSELKMVFTPQTLTLRERQLRPREIKENFDHQPPILTVFLDYIQIKDERRQSDTVVRSRTRGHPTC